MIKGISNFYNNINMRHKLFITYLMLILLPFVAFYLVNSYITSKDLKIQAENSSKQVFKQGLSYIEYKIAMIKTYMNVISVNDIIQEIVKKNPEEYEDNYGLWGFDIEEIRKQFMNAKPSMDDLANVRLYLDNSFTEIDETDDFKKMSKALNMDWYRRLTSENNTFEWFRDEGEVISAGETKFQKYISAVRILQNNENFKEALGVIKVDISEAGLKDVLDSTASASSKTSSVYLVNSRNEIICASSNTKPGYYFFAPEIIRKGVDYNQSEGVWNNFVLRNENYLVGVKRVSGTSWNMIITVPYKEILSSQSKAKKQMLLIILFIAPLTIPLAFIGAASGTKRIRRLISHMKSIQKGDFNISILSSSKDEIGKLTQNFNTMITKISMLLDEKYKLGQELKSIELKALQAQINPHFLYNTLDLIYWRAMRIKENSIYELVQSLSKFYKLSLSKGNDIVTLENEIEHVKAYVEIQNARFKNGITLVIDIPNSLHQYKIPKITLQPIVENSIIHGILETNSEKGTIQIKGYNDNARMLLEIIDDGVGIPKEKLDTILVSNSSDAFHGYGINNINNRIKLLYGDEYGLSYKSVEGKGTMVSISLPVMAES